MSTKEPRKPRAKKPAKDPITVVEPIVEKETKQANEVVREIVVHHPGEVSSLNDLKLDKKKVDLIRRTIAKGATDDELLMFINVCKGLGLSPFLRHVHFVKRWDSKLGQEVGAIQVGIDGFRSVAESTGAYAGNSDPIFKGEKTMSSGKDQYTVPEEATVTVRKIVQGVPYDFTSTARWDEFYPGDKQGFMWRSKPHVMLGKCAEAQALRKAFPKVLGGVYAPEELEQGTGNRLPQKTDDKFAKAKEMIPTATDPEVLKRFLEKVEASETYSDEQKADLKRMAEDRLGQIDPSVR